jgi:hypothetical protein
MKENGAMRSRKLFTKSFLFGMILLLFIEIGNYSPPADSPHFLYNKERYSSIENET